MGVMQKLGVSRRELYERLDRPVLKPLPQERYELSTWKRCGVNIDYHVEVDDNSYSVPYQLIYEKVEARVTASVVEVLFKGKRVASHPRKKGKGQVSTNPEHMPRSHREHLEWTPSRLLHWAEQSGRATGRLVSGILKSRPHPEQGFRSCLGVMRLGRRWGSERLEAACARAEALSSYSYRTVKNILSAGLDRVVLESDAEAKPREEHENIRGADLRRRRVPMLTPETIEKMNAMKLFGLVSAFENQLSSSEYKELSFEERVGLLVIPHVVPRSTIPIARIMSGVKGLRRWQSVGRGEDGSM